MEISIRNFNPLNICHKIERNQIERLKWRQIKTISEKPDYHFTIGFINLLKTDSFEYWCLLVYTNVIPSKLNK